MAGFQMTDEALSCDPGVTSFIRIFASHFGTPCGLNLAAAHKAAFRRNK